MKTSRLKNKADMNRNTCVSDDKERQDKTSGSQRLQPVTIQLHHQNLCLLGGRTRLTPQEIRDSLRVTRRQISNKRSASFCGGSIRLPSYGQTQSLPTVPTIVETDSPIQISGKQILQHFGKDSSLSRFNSEKAEKPMGKKNVSEVKTTVYGDPLEDTRVESNLSVARLKHSNVERSASVRDPTPPPSTEESDIHVISSILRHSINESERYFKLTKGRTESLSETVSSLKQSMKHNRQMQRRSLDDVLIRYEDKTSRERNLSFHNMESLNLPSRTMNLSPILNLISDSTITEEKRAVKLEYLTSIAHREKSSNLRGSNEKSDKCALPMLSVKTGQLCNKESGRGKESFSAANSPAKHRRQKQPVKTESVLPSTSPMVSSNYSDTSQ